MKQATFRPNGNGKFADTNGCMVLLGVINFDFVAQKDQENGGIGLLTT